MKKIFKFLLLSSVFIVLANTLQAQGVKTDNKITQEVETVDSASLKVAVHITNLAKKDLSLNSDEAEFLQEALYVRYRDGKVRTEGLTDKAKISEIKSAVHKEFSRNLYKYFGKEKSAEVLAWFYNYTNRKRDK